LEIELNAANIGYVVRVIVDATETVAHRKRGKHRGRLSAVGGRKHVSHGYVWISHHADASIHPIGSVFPVLIHTMQCVEYRGHHRQGTEVRVV